jgi:hypothetical protein
MAGGSASFVAIADSGGYVGAFEDRAAARKALRPFPAVPYLVYDFARKRPGGEHVWVLPFLANQALAAVSDSREEVVAAQSGLAALGLVCGDEVDYWKQPFGCVGPAARRRLTEETTRPFTIETLPDQEELLFGDLEDAGALSAGYGGAVGGARRRKGAARGYDLTSGVTACAPTAFVAGAQMELAPPETAAVVSESGTEKPEAGSATAVVVPDPEPGPSSS